MGNIKAHTTPALFWIGDIPPKVFGPLGFPQLVFRVKNSSPRLSCMLIDRQIPAHMPLG